MNDARRQVFCCIDYCGDIAVGRGVYSAGFSPNNIKVVVLSPDGMLVRLHKGYTGELPNGVVRLTPTIHYAGVKTVALYATARGRFDTSSEKSMCKMLVNPLVCGCIEEIIVLNAVSASYFEPFLKEYGGWEFDFNAMLDMPAEDIKGGLSKRFPRLHVLTRATIPFPAFIELLKGKGVNSNDDFTMVLGSNVDRTFTINTGTWKSGYKLQPSTYSLDNELKVLFSSGISGGNKGAVIDCLHLYSNLVTEVVSLPERTAKAGMRSIFTGTGDIVLSPVSFKAVDGLPKSVLDNPLIQFISTSENLDTVLNYNLELVFEQFKVLNNKVVDTVLRAVYYALIDMPATATQRLLVNCRSFTDNGKLLIPATSLSVLRDIQGMCRNFNVTSEGLDPRSDLGVSIVSALHFLVGFAYIGGDVGDSFSLSAMTKRIESGVFDGALKKCFEGRVGN